MGADSCAAETTRYEYVERPSRKERDFVETRQKTYWKYHITAILGLQIVLAAFTTPWQHLTRPCFQSCWLRSGVAGRLCGELL